MTFTSRIAFLGCTLFAVVSTSSTTAFSTSTTLEGLHDTCLKSEFKNCTITASGYAQVTEGPLLAYQLQAGYSEDTGTGGGAVIFEETDGKWNVITKDFLGYQYTLPRLIEGEKILLHIPGMTAGTGAYNADILLEYSEPQDGTAANWKRVDVEKWLNTVDKLLPQGLRISKGVAFDFGSWFEGDYIARTPLWRDDDPNCCASGGNAIVHFSIENSELKAESVDYLPVGKTE